MNGRDDIAVDVPADAVARALDGMSDYRVLRRVTPPGRPDRGRGAFLLSGCALDVETTGLNHRTDSIIELALRRFWVDTRGRVVASGRSHAWYEDPGRPLPPEIVGITGITDQDVAGRSIEDGAATCLILDADFVVAHNASFDRPFVERRLPLAAGRPWVCSMRDVDWRGLGFEGRVLSHLLGQMGWFYEAHRADVDVLALLRLLDHAPDRAPRTVILEALSRASRPTWVVEAEAAPFEAKDRLKERGYRWNAEMRCWCREVAHDALEEEIAWARTSVYARRRGPLFRRVDWCSRYGAT